MIRGHERFVNEIDRHNSDTVNYSSSLRTKEENLNNMCSESSKLAVVNHGQSSQDSNNVKTKVELLSVHRETVASTIRSPGLLEKQQRRQQQSHVNTSGVKVHLHKKRDPPKRTELGLLFLDARNAKGIPLIVASPNVSQIWFDTMTKTNEKQMERCIGMLHFLY